MDQAIIRLMAVSTEKRDLGWLKESLQAAVLLELSTIPPYLCGLWSIKSGDGPVFDLVNSVVLEEMFHMGIVCNILVALGDTPKIVSGYRDHIKYPGKLPGGVRPELIVFLAGLTKEYVRTVYLGIETPEGGNIVHAALVKETFPTIGAFYGAIISALNQLNPTLSSQGQLTVTIDGNVLSPITTVAGAVTLIKEITEQGEGTSQTPFAPDFGAELAHFYRFKEIVEGKTVVADASGGFTFGDPPIPFPDVFAMAPVPKNGYKNPTSAVAAALKAFNEKFTQLLIKLDSAWGNGSQPDLGSAIGAMASLQPLATTLLNFPIPGGNDVYGPEFKLIHK